MACKQYKIFVVNCEIHLKEIGVDNEMIYQSVKGFGQSTITFGGGCGVSRTFQFSDIVSPPFDSPSDLNDYLETELAPCAASASGAQCYEHTQAVAATEWNVAHNTGVMQPCGFHIVNAATGNMMLGNVKPIDANNLTVFFGLALAGTIKLTFG